MILNTAVDVNILLEDLGGKLTPVPSTLHVSSSVSETRNQFRERLMTLVEEHYQEEALVVSMIVIEQGELGKRVVALKRPLNESDSLECCEATSLEIPFRTGGNILRLIPESAPLH